MDSLPAQQLSHDSIWGFDLALRNGGAAPYRVLKLRGTCRLLLCNAVHAVLKTSLHAAGWPLLYFGRQGRGLRPRGFEVAVEPWLRVLVKPDISWPLTQRLFLL